MAEMVSLEAMAIGAKMGGMVRMVVTEETAEMVLDQGKMDKMVKMAKTEKMVKTAVTEVMVTTDPAAAMGGMVAMSMLLCFLPISSI
jgi:hypothetical protein